MEIVFIIIIIIIIFMEIVFIIINFYRDCINNYYHYFLWRLYLFLLFIFITCTAILVNLAKHVSVLAAAALARHGYSGFPRSCNTVPS